MHESWICPTCGRFLTIAMCCTQDDEWLFVCYDCKTTYTVEEMAEIEMDKRDAVMLSAADTAPSTGARD